MSASAGKRKLSASSEVAASLFDEFEFNKDELPKPLSKSKSMPPVVPPKKLARKSSTLKKKPSKFERIANQPLFWLMKCEPEDLTVDQLRKMDNSTTMWDGVRNYEARNNMREMKLGDQCFFYESNVKEPRILAIMKVVREAYDDPTQFDRNDVHYDESSDKANAKWQHVDVQLVEELARPVTRAAIKADSFLCESMVLFRRNRLSVTPVKKDEWDRIVQMANK